METAKRALVADGDTPASMYVTLGSKTREPLYSIDVPVTIATSGRRETPDEVTDRTTEALGVP